MLPPLRLLVMIAQKDQSAPSILESKPSFFSHENFLVIKGTVLGQTKGPASLGTLLRSLASKQGWPCRVQVPLEERRQVVPMEDINLHFTGDFHAIGAANNLLAAMLDNHIQQGNALGIDVKRITWKRCVDMNDRQLRNIVCGLGGRMQGVPREDGFDITVASEIMAVMCLADGISDLKERLARMIVAYTFDGKPVTAGDLKAQGVMAALLKDALKPNLVQTLEHTPAFVHCGPFANIAHGCNSVTATRLAMKLADYAVTEAGFGADLGAEKFLDIKCRIAGLKPENINSMQPLVANSLLIGVLAVKQIMISFT